MIFKSLSARDQSFIDLSEMCMGGGFVERIGVERFQFALVGIAQGLGRCRRTSRKATIETVVAASKV